MQSIAVFHSFQGALPDILFRRNKWKRVQRYTQAQFRAKRIKAIKAQANRIMSCSISEKFGETARHIDCNSITVVCMYL